MYEQIKNIVIDTNYTDILENGWFPNVNENFSNNNRNNWENKGKKKWFFDSFIESLIPQKNNNNKTTQVSEQASWNI